MHKRERERDSDIVCSCSSVHNLTNKEPWRLKVKLTRKGEKADLIRAPAVDDCCIAWVLKIRWPLPLQRQCTHDDKY